MVVLQRLGTCLFLPKRLRWPVQRARCVLSPSGRWHAGPADRSHDVSGDERQAAMTNVSRYYILPSTPGLVDQSMASRTVSRLRWAVSLLLLRCCHLTCILACTGSRGPPAAHCTPRTPHPIVRPRVIRIPTPLAAAWAHEVSVRASATAPLIGNRPVKSSI